MHSSGWRRVSLDLMEASRAEYHVSRAMSSASDPILVETKTGYDTWTDLFVLDYRSIIDSHLCLDSIPMKQWDLSVWQFKDDKWNVWEVWRIRDRQTTAGTDMDKISVSSLINDIIFSIASSSIL